MARKDKERREKERREKDRREAETSGKADKNGKTDKTDKNGKNAKNGKNDKFVAEIKAAGGIVVRSGKKGPKVLLIHRERYNDWSFPKGKLDPGEKFKEAAHREVQEETGFDCRLHKPSLPSILYKDRNGRCKEVRYWLMTAISGEFTPNDEVELIAWVRWDKVTDRLTYEKDKRFFADVVKSGRIEQVLQK